MSREQVEPPALTDRGEDAVAPVRAAKAGLGFSALDGASPRMDERRERKGGGQLAEAGGDVEVREPAHDRVRPGAAVPRDDDVGDGEDAGRVPR